MEENADALIEEQIMVYSCSICKISFLKEKKLKKHLKSHSDKHTLTCSDCNKAFAVKKELKKHMKIHTFNSILYQSNKKVRFESENMMQGLFVQNREQPRNTTLHKNHSEMHSRVHLHATDQSTANSASISQVDSLQKHKSSESREQPYKCQNCEKAYSRLRDLKYHSRIHTELHTCLICDKSFSRTDQFVAHRRIHTGERPYTCAICEKSFSTGGDLRKHKRTHSGERPYCCKICRQSFALLHNLKSHLRTHSGEKPYACNICNKPFSRASNMRRHESTIHNVE